MKKWIIVCTALVSFVFTACERVVGEGPIVTQNRSIANFSGVDLRMNATVNYSQAPNYKVEVKAQDNIQNILITELQNGRLVIRTQNDINLRRHEPIVINVSSPELSSLRVSGSGDIYAGSLVDANSLEMDISGSGNIEMADLVALLLDANISGSGDIDIKTGVVPSEKLRISGSGNIDLRNVLSKSVNTTTSGSGTTYVNVSEQLNVTISGSGNVYYKGQPSVNAGISGSGKLRSL